MEHYTNVKTKIKEECLMAWKDMHPQMIKPMSPASAGRFLTTGPPGKSDSSYFTLLVWY